MTSVSEVVWKIDPSASSRSRSSTALTRLPLCADRDRAARVVDRDRLGVLSGRVARGRVAHVPDGGEAAAGSSSRSAVKMSLTCPISRTQRSLSPSVETMPGRLLPAVLEGVQAEVGQVRRFRVAVDADDPAHGAAKLAHSGRRRSGGLAFRISTLARLRA